MNRIFSGDFLERYLRADFEINDPPQEKVAAFSGEPRNLYEGVHTHTVNISII
jgi:hypothetical protein